MTPTVDIAAPAAPSVCIRTREPFSPGWNRIAGIHVDCDRLQIDASEYFFRYENPSWIVCDWDVVRDELLTAVETPEVAVEQRVLEFVTQRGRRTSDPAEVLSIAGEVYSHLFRDERLADPGLGGVTVGQLRMLREMGTVMALNRVELDGSISTVGPAWFFPVASRVVFDLDERQATQLDELYHGTFFNEPRRLESVKAHAALGGRLVHGCQSGADMSGGCVVPYGADIDRFQTDLAAFKQAWIETIYAAAGR